MEYELNLMRPVSPHRLPASRRTMSMNVRRLQESLNALLNERDRGEFIDALNLYHSRRNVLDFVQALQLILDTPAKRHLVPLLKKVIPKSDVAQFDQCMSGQYGYNTLPARPTNVQRTTSMPPLLRNTVDVPRRPLGNRSQSFRAPAPPLGLYTLPNEYQDREVKKICLRQPTNPGEGFGFSIRGGSEHGIGIFVSSVDVDSVAERQGLLPGDQILTVNDISFEEITHEEAAKIIKAARKLEVVVRNVGKVPGSSAVHATYNWIDSLGRAASPPPEVDKTRRYDSNGERKSGLMLLKDSDERKVNLVIGAGGSLGLMIRGGNEFGLGIYITGVDKYSVAENAGIKVGDQVLDVNGVSFLDISHTEAVKVLKSSKHMMMTVKDVGKLPYAKTVGDTTEWITNGSSIQRPPSRGTLASLSNGYGSLKKDDSIENNEPIFSRGAGSQLMLSSMSNTQWSMIQEQAFNLLNENERGTMNYYLAEYHKGHVSIDALVLALFELLNTHAKFSLLSEIRIMIGPRDLDRFDNLVLEHEVEAMKARQPVFMFGDQLSENSFESYSSHSRYSSESNKDSLEGSVIGGTPLLSLPKLPSKLPPNMKLAKDIRDPLQIAIEQINDDTHGLPDYLKNDEPLMMYHQPPSPPRKTSPITRHGQSDKLTVVDVHPAPVTVKGYEDTRSPSEDSGVEMNGHSNHSSETASLPTPPSRVTVSPQQPVIINDIIEENSWVTDVEETCVKTAILPDDRSPPEPIRMLPESSRIERRPSVDSIATDSNSSNSGSYSPARRGSNASDKSGRRHYSDPTHHVPREQQRSVDQKRKTSEQLFELKKQPISIQQSSREVPFSGNPIPSTSSAEPQPSLVTIYKSKPTLGIAIEGGANTRQPLPRIINIQPGGSAHESGGLRIGHVILEVDSRLMAGLEHKEAARSIAEAFKRRDTAQMELLVTQLPTKLKV